MLRRLGFVFLFAFVCVAATTSLHAQDDAQALLKRMQAKAIATRSLSTHIVLTRRGDKGETLMLTGTAKLLKPNFAEIKLTGDDTYPPHQTNSDGRDLYLFLDEKSYSVSSVDTHGTVIREPWWSLPLTYFFAQSLNPFGPQPDPTETCKLLPDETRDGKTVHVLGVQGTQPFGYTGRFTIDETDRIVASEIDFGTGPGAAFYKAELSDLVTGVALTPAAFRFTAPAGAQRKEGTLADLMLPIGEQAPNFRLPALDGSQQTLEANRKGAKATLVNFWFVNCPPCRVEFPEFQKLYARLHDKGFNIVAVDKGDDAAAVTKVARSDGLTFPILLGGEPNAKSVFASYRVTDTFPASYLIDAQGKVVYRSASVDLEGLTKALASLGVR